MTRTEEINALIRDTDRIAEEIAEMKRVIRMEMERTERMKNTLAELKSRLA